MSSLLEGIIGRGGRIRGREGEERRGGKGREGVYAPLRSISFHDVVIYVIKSLFASGLVGTDLYSCGAKLCGITAWYDE